MIIYKYTLSPLVHDSNKPVAHRVADGGSREWIDIASSWGFRRCSFRLFGQCESLYDVERVTDGSTFLFCILSYAFTELMNCPAPMEPRRSKYDLCHGNMKRANLNQLSLAIELYFCNKY